MKPSLPLRAWIAPIALAAAIAGGAGSGEPAPSDRSRAQAEALLSRRITVDLRGQTLGDAFTFITGVAGLEGAPFWAEPDGRAGLDPEVSLNIQLRNATVEEAIERILAAVAFEPGDEPTWQIGEHGELQVGPRSRLNAHRRVETYSISDLIRATPDFTDAPTIDLASALQPGGGTIFSGEEAGPPVPPTEAAETPAEQIVRLITTLVEPAQWKENGGQGAGIHIFRDSLVIDAPEYIHRQIAGTGRGRSRTGIHW